MRCGWKYWGTKPRTHFYGDENWRSGASSSTLVIEAFEPQSGTCFPSLEIADGIFDESLWCENGFAVDAKESSRADKLRNFALRRIELVRVGARSFHQEHEVKDHMLYVESISRGERRMWERRAATKVQANARRCLAKFELQKLRKLSVERHRQTERVKQLLAQRREGKRKMMQLRRHCAMTLKSRVRGWKLRTRKRALQIRIRDQDFAYRDVVATRELIQKDVSWDYMRGGCIRGAQEDSLTTMLRFKVWRSGAAFEVRAYHFLTRSTLHFRIKLSEMLHLLIDGSIARLSNLIVTRDDLLRAMLGWLQVVEDARGGQRELKLTWCDWLRNEFPAVNAYESKVRMKKYATPEKLADVEQDEKRLLKDCKKESKLAVAFCKKQRGVTFKHEKELSANQKELQHWIELRKNYMQKFSVAPEYTKEISVSAGEVWSDASILKWKYG